jgi:hypothetical protein
MIEAKKKLVPKFELVCRTQSRKTKNDVILISDTGMISNSNRLSQLVCAV